MPDYQQAAIEAVDDALRADQWDGDPEDLPGSMTSEAEIAVEAAEPHLRKKWADELRETLNPPSNQRSQIWRSGFIVGVLQAARFLEEKSNHAL